MSSTSDSKVATFSQNNNCGPLPKSGISYTNAYNGNSNFDFVPPEEAPVFRPTAEEFAKGPLEYIAKIRDKAEKFGICKIIPPQEFQPPFTVDVEKFRFTPRVQRLNELEAQTRVKLNFLEQVIKYWDLQGQQIKIPSIDKKLLDLYGLYRAVESEGGFETCVREKKWSIIASKLGLINTSHNKGTLASLIRHHYEKILYPFDLFVQGVLAGTGHAIFDESQCETDCSSEPSADKKMRLDINAASENENTSAEDCKSDGKPLRISPRRLSRRLNCYQDIDNSSKDQQKIQPLTSKINRLSPDLINSPKKSDTNENPECKRCSSAVDQIDLVKCAFCQKYVHVYCLIPPLTDVPKSSWNCPECISLLFQTQPQAYTQEFGFAQSQRSYSLAEFGEIADQFKTDYFKMPCHLIPLDLVEKEFWRLVSSIEDMVSVEYGADLHTFDFGSGFPTKDAPTKRPEDAPYVDHPWNLNNLPVLESSVFKYINTDINGMIIPWMYVGMCFSTFCWHNEDHWSYSINYLHWGEAKTWYGVPGSSADQFESAMKQSAPELFASQPDLLHQLVTICNPNLLQSRGVPIYRINQLAGEFVVTFPRAYHAGFNQGLNFAEAVNFSPADWISLGRDCMAHYKRLHRFPVFSHDELVCKMANDPDLLDIALAQETYSDLERMIEDERQVRERIFKLGITKSKRVIFELLPDDERQCEYCKTTCFLSGISCECLNNKLVCPSHVHRCCDKCDVPELILRYRYTLDELPLMLVKPKQRVDSFQKWLTQVEHVLTRDTIEQSALKCADAADNVDNCSLNVSSTSAIVDANTNTNANAKAMSTVTSGDHESKAESPIDIMHLKKLVVEAKRNNFPLTTPQMEQLVNLIDWSRNISNVCESILQQQRRLDVTTEQARRSKLMRISKSSKRGGTTNEDSSYHHHHFQSYQQTNNQHHHLSDLNRSGSKGNDSKVNAHAYYSINNKLKLFEFVELVDEMKALPCKITEHDAMIELCERVINIQKNMDKTLNQKQPERNMDSAYLDELISQAESIANVDFGKSMIQLKYKYEESIWLEECQSILSPMDDQRKKKHQIDINIVQKLIYNGENLTLYTVDVQNQLIKLTDIVTQYENWINRAKQIIDQSTHFKSLEGSFNLTDYMRLPTISSIEQLLNEVDEHCLLIKFNLNPAYDDLNKIIKEGKAMNTELEQLLNEKSEVIANQSVEIAEQLFEQARLIPCQLSCMPQLAKLCQQVSDWREKMQRAFNKKVCLYRLPAILLPRTKSSLPNSIDLIASNNKVLFQQLKKLYQINTNLRKNHWFEKQLNGDYSYLSISDAYHEAELSEAICIKEIREKNLLRTISFATPQPLNISVNNDMNTNNSNSPSTNTSTSKDLNTVFNDANTNGNNMKVDETKKPNSSNNECLALSEGTTTASDQETEEDSCDRELDPSKQKYCVCGKQANGWMIQCQLCSDWFHVHCVENYSPLLTSIFSGKRKCTIDKHGASFLLEELDTRKHFLYVCVLCARGKRPTLEQAHQLYESIQHIPFSVIEQQLLACLIARAQRFQRRVARELNARPKFAVAYEQLRKNLYMDLYASTNKASNFKRPYRKSIHNTNSNANTNKIGGAIIADADTTTNVKYSNKCNDNPKMSAATLIRPKNMFTCLSSKKKRNILQQVRNLIIALNDETRCIIRDLLFEACLLELSVDETHVLWVMSVLDEPVEPTAIEIDYKSEHYLPIQNQYFNYKRKSNVAVPSSTLNDIDLNELNEGTDSSKKRKNDQEDNKMIGPIKKKRKECSTLHVNACANSSKKMSKLQKVQNKMNKSKNNKFTMTKSKGKQQSQQQSKQKQPMQTQVSSNTCATSNAHHDNSSESEAEVEICLKGDQCLLPHDEEVDWVFCEGECQGWYHVRCLDLGSDVNLSESEQYICIKCQANQNDRKCASGNDCLDPSFENVHWIQCDGPCKLWFHQFCVGFEDPQQVSQLINFFCVQCDKQPKPTDVQASSSTQTDTNVSSSDQS